jgi:hypothetical protein
MGSARAGREPGGRPPAWPPILRHLPPTVPCTTSPWPSCVSCTS